MVVPPVVVPPNDNELDKLIAVLVLKLLDVLFVMLLRRSPEDLLSDGDEVDDEDPDELVLQVVSTTAAVELEFI